MKKNRIGKKKRVTKETSIQMELNLDGQGCYHVKTTIPFLDHMLELFTKHGCFDLTVTATGDRHVDDHHLVEDTGIVLGEVIEEALGRKRGIARYGQDLKMVRKAKALTPMDESLSYVALDLSGRPFLDYKAGFKPQSKSPFSFELFEDFFQGLAFGAKINLHIQLLKGRNNHHMAESLFKGFARALAQAVRIDPKRKANIPSTKGKL